MGQEENTSGCKGKIVRKLLVRVVAVALRVSTPRNIFSGKIQYLDTDGSSKSQYARQNGNDNQCVVEVEEHTVRRSAARQRVSVRSSLITCQEVTINALQRPPGLHVPCWVVPPAVTRVAEVLCDDQDLQV